LSRCLSLSLVNHCKMKVKSTSGMPLFLLYLLDSRILWSSVGNASLVVSASAVSAAEENKGGPFILPVKLADTTTQLKSGSSKVCDN
jgi:hypothetical protein